MNELPQAVLNVNFKCSSQSGDIGIACLLPALPFRFKPALAVTCVWVCATYMNCFVLNAELFGTSDEHHGRTCSIQRAYHCNRNLWQCLAIETRLCLVCCCFHRLSLQLVVPPYADWSPCWCSCRRFRFPACDWSTLLKSRRC
jgi:hypothetical protein